MNIAQIETNLQKVIKSIKKNSFIYDLLLAYGQPKASIVRLQKGGLNLSKVEGEISWKKKLFFKTVKGKDLHAVIDEIKADATATKHDPRFIIVTDFETLLAVDRKTTDTLDIPIFFEFDDLRVWILESYICRDIFFIAEIPFCRSIYINGHNCKNNRR